MEGRDFHSLVSADWRIVLMKKQMRCLWFVLLGLILPLAVQADKTADAKKAIQAAIDRENAALKKKDLAGLTATLAPGFVQTDNKGRQHTREQTVAMMQQILPIAQKLDAKSTVTKIVLKGDQATATVKEHADITVMNPQTKRTARLVTDSVEEGVWQNTGGKWLRKSSRTLKHQATLDGKPYTSP